ncbi:ras-related protein Rab-44 [Eublepharis macularius]|uniref:Ras-related protein Rab-44 n=1 Tax=Eublepharis macularius TaxID=481883 RepID=A0AA97JB96_EUBMA|nr:ras-related protein Rab-44 [Eublepharis macularius]
MAGHVLSSQTVTRRHRKKKGTLLKAPANLSQEEVETEQQKCFEAFIDQLGADSIFEDQSEIWTIWMQLQQDESHLLGNLKELLAKMTHLIKEAKHAKKKLQLMLNMRVADHNKEVQQLYEEMEQQIEREKKKLQRETEIRSQIYSVEMQKVLDVREREILHFLGVQKQLETEFFSLQEKQYKASTKNQQLKQANIALKNQLQKAFHQLQETQRHLDVMKKKVSQMLKEGGRDGLLEEVSSKTPPTPQDENEMVTSELKMNFEYRLNEDTQDSSVQQAPEDDASTTKAESEPRTRVISIEWDPLAEFTEEQQHFLQEPLGQSSLLRELNDAIAGLSKVPESHQQQMHDLGLQGQESSNQISQGESNKYYIIQEKIAQYEALFRNDGPGKRTFETDQGALQQESLLKGQSYVQDNILEMKKTNNFEPQMDFKALVSMQRGISPPEVRSHCHSKLTSQVSNPPNSPVLKDILSLGQVTQPKLHKKVLKMRERIQTQWPSIDYEQRLVKKNSMERKTGKEILSIKGMLPVCFPPRTVQPKLHVEHGAETSLVHNSQMENVSKSEMQIQTPEEREELLAEERREGLADMFECEKNQEAGTEMVKETNVKIDDQDCQVNAGTKETPKGTNKDVCSCPEHLYNVLFVGDSNVGKTSFLCRLHDDSFTANLTATIGMDYRITNLFVDNKCFALRLWDTAGQERYHSVTKQFFRKADGVVLMYDITSEHSFADVQYWLSCIQEGAGNGVVILLLGNKTDHTAYRRVSVEDGSCLAKEYGLSFYECSAASGHNVLESMVKFVRLLKAHEDKLKQEILELPAIPTKKRGCC